MQITVFCSGSAVYDNGVSVGGANPIALDAIKASGVSYTGYLSSYGYYLTSIAGCGGDWGPSFMVNGEASPLGVSGYQISEGDLLIFLGPNSASGEAKYLFLTNVPSTVGKGDLFRVRVMEQDGYGFMPATPSAGAEVSFGNDTVTTDGNGFTPEIYLDQDAFYCISAIKSGCVPSYYLGGLPWIQCGAGGDYICSVTGEGIAPKGNIKYDESSSVSGVGFSSCRNHFENNFGGSFPARTSDIRQKGSGSYNAEKVVKQRPSGIDLSESTELRYNPTAFKAYNQSLSYKSKYEDSTYQKNYNKATESSERYRQLDSLKKMSSYNNSQGINYSFTASFQGIADLSARSLDEGAFSNWKEEARPKEESLETYIGNFTIFRRGFLPICEKEEATCEEECQWDCTEHCMDEGYSEEYCTENCSDYCEDYCGNLSYEEDYELLPCCDGGWTDMIAADRVGHSVEGLFGCQPCSMNA